MLSKRIDDAKRKQSIYSQISLNCYGSGGSNTGQKNSAFGHPYCLESKCSMHLSETRHSKENGWAYIVSSAVCFDRLDMSHYFYSLNVTQEGTDVNGFWANGQPMKIM